MVDADILALVNDAARRREAFEMIVARYQHKVLRLAYSILRERTAAEDAAQDALLRIWRGLGRFRGESSLSTWIYSIARNAALSARSSRPDQASLEESHLGIASKSFLAPPAEHAAPDVLRLMESLPDAQRQVVILFYLEDKSYLETAAMTGLPMGTVKTYLHRARKELALALASSKKMTPRTSV
jgi:RNA polymerase sigma-70 factor (ECF subfamily)